MKNIKENIKEIDRKSRGFMGEFRKFIARGNVMDMAVGVIIGAAFKSIVDSLVNDILMLTEIRDLLREQRDSGSDK